ncbi:hypothetical protein ES705_22115 [subsurface metagenome]
MVNPRLAVIPISPQINLHCLIVMSWVWGGVLPARGGGWGSTGIMPLLALSPSLFWGLGAGSPHPSTWLTCWLTPHPLTFKVSAASC